LTELLARYCFAWSLQQQDQYFKWLTVELDSHPALAEFAGSQVCFKGPKSHNPGTLRRFGCHCHTAMKRVQGLVVSKALFAALSVGLIFAGIAQAQIRTFTGKFTLTSINAPTAALIRDGNGRPVGWFTSGIDGRKTSTGNALLIRDKHGQLRVYALALADLGMVLVYDPALAREAVMEARVPETVPVMLAKR
jgi:hypothetical protein